MPDNTDFSLNQEKIGNLVLHEEICLDNYSYKPSFSSRLRKKTGKKDLIVKEKYPNAEITMLIGQQLNTKKEKIIDNLLGWLTVAPFGIPEMINGFKNIDKEFYLVSVGDEQHFVTVTDKFIEVRKLKEKIENKKFKIGNWRYVKCGILK